MGCLLDVIGCLGHFLSAPPSLGPFTSHLARLFLLLWLSDDVYSIGWDDCCADESVYAKIQCQNRYLLWLAIPNSRDIFRSADNVPDFL
ncbi:MAG: hypothetical protein J3Q66DRAFT_327676 [Benniella sp.]|nr:MAG: hypothetical protein J3Q66DRAFT_347780 [Benniella sp.]KAK3825340.1 MAG: hypothetical protein J3Q66DRAFT_327520 [Benniella sp.]KAK3825405.1 MAG: hypothetical protein J3Q66DRAFT_327676 [Benniella sp.]